VRRLLKDLQVVPGAAAFVPAVAEPVIGDAEARRREQIIAIGVVREGAGLAHQGIDHVPVVNRVLVATN
jgi:hypothetical protein